MAQSKSAAARDVERLLQNAGIGLDSCESLRMSTDGDALIGGYRCKVVNMMSSDSANVLVNTAWFNFKAANYARPRMQHSSNRQGFDFELIPTKEKLFVLHYLQLRQYTLGLERDRETWFNRSWWGIRINESKNSFVWAGGNTIEFPLFQLTKSEQLRTTALGLASQFAAV